jgi:hypothetical protein
MAYEAVKKKAHTLQIALQIVLRNTKLLRKAKWKAPAALISNAVLSQLNSQVGLKIAPSVSRAPSMSCLILDAPALLARSQSRGRIRFPAAVYFLCPFCFFHGYST